MPAHTVSIALVLLSFNEKNNLIDLLPGLPLNLFDRVLAVDGGSTDGTLEIYAQYGIDAFVQKKRGRGNAFQQAEKIVGEDMIIFFSTDGNENPLDLPKMIEYLRDGADLVVAGRYLLDGSQTDNTDDPLRIRRFAGIAGGWLTHALWSTGVKDPINGFRGFHASSLRRLALDAPKHEIELQSTIRAAKLGMNIVEFATCELPRRHEARKSSAGTVRLMFNLGIFLVREIFIGRRFLRAAGEAVVE